MSPVPENWVEAALGDICDLVNGRAFKPSEWSAEGKPIIRIQNLNRATASFNYYSGAVEPRYAVRKGDLLFAWSGTPGTSFGAHIWSGGDAVLNQHIFRIDFNRDLIDPIFFKLAINQTLNELIDQAHGGAGLRHVTKDIMQKTIVRMPPFAAQQRIAKTVLTIESRLDAASTNIAAASKLVKIYQQAVLRHAFEGSHDASGQPRSTATLASLVQDGPTNGWSPRTGSDAAGALTLRQTATTSGHLRLDEAAVKRIYDNPAADSRYWLRPGDLLVQRANAIDHLGSAAIFDGPTNTYIYPDLMMRIRIEDPDQRRYLWRYLNSAPARAFLRERATGTAGNMPKISGGTLRDLPVPLPLSGDYRSIADMIDLHFKLIASVQTAASEGANALSSLRKSVIAKAFEGRLVPVDPGDEPASSLLSRLRQWRNETGGRQARRVRPRDDDPITAKEVSMSEKRRVDVPPDHLTATLTILGGRALAKELWRNSDMTIDEFYKQLRVEMRAGGMRTGQFRDELVTADAT